MVKCGTLNPLGLSKTSPLTSGLTMRHELRLGCSRNESEPNSGKDEASTDELLELHIGEPLPLELSRILDSRLLRAVHDCELPLTGNEAKLISLECV